MKKITVVGDIMCEPRMLKAARRSDGTYSFDGVFEHVRSLFLESDYVIGNLETPLAGDAAGLTAGLFSFNTPDSFAEAIQRAGIDMVLTANNHCLDRGIDGLERTLKVLDEFGITHTGTYSRREDTDFVVKDLGDARVAFISYTYGTNYADNKIILPEDCETCVNLLRPQDERYFISDGQAVQKNEKLGAKNSVKMKLRRLVTPEMKARLKKALHKPYNQAHEDNNLNVDTAQKYFERLHRDINRAKEAADLVVFLPHVGGQFNARPGLFTKYVFDYALEAGCDAVIASHPHVVQKATLRGQVPCFYSLGNFSMSPNSYYLLHERLPEYGLAAHLYVEEGKILKASYSILKIVETGRHVLAVYPVDILYDHLKSAKKRSALENDVQRIIRAVNSIDRSNDEIIKKEYVLKRAESDR